MSVTNNKITALIKAGTALSGKISSYTVLQELHTAFDGGAVFLAKNDRKEKCIIKSIQGHWRLENEAKVLERYQQKSEYLRPLIDRIQDPNIPPSIVLKYLDNDLLKESNKKRLSRKEIKYVAKRVLQALAVLHNDGMVHTDIKLDNIFVNYGVGSRFSEIQLGDCGGVVSEESKYAKEGHLIGAGYTRSPEATFQLPWRISTDIWSFGNMVLSLLYGGNYHLFNPGIDGKKLEDEDYELTVLKRMYKFFGPFPQSYENFADPDTITIVNFINNTGPPEKPFERVTQREIPSADNKFIRRIMQLDPRERPIAEELLKDEWFLEESKDTREPLM